MSAPGTAPLPLIESADLEPFAPTVTADHAVASGTGEADSPAPAAELAACGLLWSLLSRRPKARTAAAEGRTAMHAALRAITLFTCAAMPPPAQCGGVGSFKPCVVLP